MPCNVDHASTGNTGAMVGTLTRTDAGTSIVTVWTSTGATTVQDTDSEAEADGGSAIATSRIAVSIG